MGEIRSDRIARYLELIEKPDEALDVIVQRMTGGELGYEGLPAICRALDVPYGKVIGWLMADAERYAVYNRALEVQAKALVSEAVEIADEGSRVVTDMTGKPLLGDDGKPVVVEGDVARDKLRVDTRFRLAKYHDSRVYGDKVDINHNVAPVFIIHAAPAEVVLENPPQITATEITDAEYL